jgi:hypothetical protein
MVATLYTRAKLPHVRLAGATRNLVIQYTAGRNGHTVCLHATAVAFSLTAC